MGPGRDRISQLPAGVLDRILGFLRIQDAAKTAVLSSIWRDVWLSLTQLNFDAGFFCYNRSRCYASNFNYLSASTSGCYVINKVLLLHNGTIRKLLIHFDNVGIHEIRVRSYDFDQWLILVTQKGVEEIYLHFQEKEYSLPNCVLSCLTLKRLHLNNVILRRPVNFPCILPNVASLSFEWVECVPINCLDCAINVPMLESLSFINCKNMFHFDITAPKLCSLTIKSTSSYLLDKFLPVNLDLSSISTLHLDGSLQQFVKEFTRMGFQLNVEYLKLSCSYNNSYGSASALVDLLQLFPKLCKLDLDLFMFRAMKTEYKDSFSKLLSKLHAAAQTNKMLHALKLFSFRGSQYEILFNKDVLASFSALENVVIVRDGNYSNKESTRIMQELLDFPVASTEAKIIII